MKVLLSVFLALTTISARGGAAPNKKAAVNSAKSDARSEIDQALKPLRKKEGVTVALKKRSVNSLLAKERISEGKLHFWQGKLRVETQSPDESLLVMDGKTLWLATKLPEEMGGKTLVSKTKARSFKKSNTLFAALLGDGNLFDEFKITDRSTIDEDIRLEMVPKIPESTEIQKLDLWLTTKERKLTKVVYWDDKENEVTFDLGEPKTINGNRQALFSYKPPKDAEVTEF